MPNINSPQPVRKGILKSPPVREEPAPKSQKVEIDLSGAEANGSEMNVDVAVESPPGLPGQSSQMAEVPSLPSVFGGSLPGFNYGGDLSNSEVNGNGKGGEEGKKGQEGKKGEEGKEDGEKGKGEVAILL